MSKLFKKPRGFTLIEMLVVLAIIGILATILLVSLNAARTRARDTKRKSDIEHIVAALQVYYSTHGIYPATSYAGACGTAIDGTDLLSAGLIGDKLLAALPATPSNSGTCGDAYYSGSWNSAQNIAVLTKLENNDASCVAWPGPTGWNLTGTYCDGKYIQTLP